MAKVLFSRGLSTVYTGLAEKQADTIYFLTDTQQIYLGEQLIADTTKLNVQFVDAVPEFDTAKEDVVYVVPGTNGGIYIKGDSAMDQVSGGEATEVADGILDLGNFAEGVVSTEIGGSPTDTTIPTSQAVKEYVDTITQTLNTTIDGLIKDITVQTPSTEETPGTVLLITKEDGSSNTITIADIFLSAASYDSGSHILTLTLNDTEQSTVTVDLSTLIGNSLSDVTVGEDEAFTVELGAGGTLGGYKTGDSISADTSIETIIKKLLMKQVPPTYIQPAISIANNSGTAAGNYEYGTSITPNLRATFTQNDAGALTNIQFQKNNSNVGDPQTSSPATYTEAQFSLTETTSFRAIATYAEGAIKNDNLGQPYEEGHIQAGSKNSSNFTYTPFRNVFYGATTDKPSIDSAYIRGLTAKGSAYSANAVLTFTAALGSQRVVVAYPQTASSNKPVFETTTGLTLDVSANFTSQNIDVEGANGAAAVTYTVWVFEPAVPYDPATDFRVTLK